MSSWSTIAEKNLLIDPQIVPEWVREAFIYVYKAAEECANFTEIDICSIHKNLGLTGRYRTELDETIGVLLGTDHPYSPADSQEIPTLMYKYQNAYASIENVGEPLQSICEAYFIFQHIHPFSDGNGRTGRLICAWLMCQNNYTFLIPFLEKRWGGNVEHRIQIFRSANNNYYGCLGNPDVFNAHFSAFYLYFLKEIKILLEEMD
jgi:Fic family protein